MLRVTLIYVFVFLISKISCASVVESVQSGDWSSETTWLNGIEPLINDTVLIHSGDTIFINSSSASCFYLINEGIVYFKSASNKLDASISSFYNGAITGTSLGTFSTNSMTIYGTSSIDKCHLNCISIVVNDTLNLTSNSGTKICAKLINNGLINNIASEDLSLNGNLTNRGEFKFGEGKIKFLKASEIYGSIALHEIELTDQLTNNDSLIVVHKISGSGYVLNKGNLILGMTDANFKIDSLDLSHPNNTCIFNREGNQTIPKLKNNAAQEIKFIGNGNYSIANFMRVETLKAEGTSTVTINQLLQIKELKFEELTTCIINKSIFLSGNSHFGNIDIENGSNLTMNHTDSIYISGDFNGELLGSPIVVYNGTSRQFINPMDYENLVYDNSGFDSSVIYGNNSINTLTVRLGKLKVGDLSIKKCTINALGELQLGGHSPVFTDTIFIDGKLTINSNSAAPSYHFIYITHTGMFINNSSANISIESGIHNDGSFQGCSGTACTYNFTNNSALLKGNDTIFLTRIIGNEIRNKGIVHIEKELNIDTLFNTKNATLLLRVDTQNLTGFLDLSAENNTIIFNKNGTQNIPKSILKAYNIGFVNSGNKVLSENLEIKNNLFISNYSNLKCDSFQITGNKTGHVQIDSLSNLTLGHNYSLKNISFPTLFTTINLHNSSTVIYAAKGDQTISSNPYYGNLIIDDGAIDSCEKIISGDSLIVNGDLELAESSLKLMVNDKTVVLKGDWNGPGQVKLTQGKFHLSGNGNSDGFVHSGASEFIYDGYGAQKIKIMDYYNLTINKIGKAYTKANTGSLSVNKNTWVKNGTLDFNSEMCHINHLIIEDSVTFSSKYQEKYFNNITIHSTGVFLLNYDEELYFEGDIMCDGKLLIEQGVVTFNDTLTPQKISGSGTLKFNQTKIKNNSQILEIDCEITLMDTLFMQDGAIKINSHVQLRDRGYIYGEKQSNALIGSGKISLNKPIISGNYENIGGLGLTINSPTPMGNTLIERELIAYEVVGLEGIKRTYTIEPEFNYGLNVSLNFNFWTSELNKNILDDLEIYKSIDGGNNWSPQGGILDTLSKAIRLSGITSFSKWTAGGGNIGPLAVELMEFKGQRIKENILLEWTVYSEIGTKEYQINYSLDGLKFDSLTTILASQTENYHFIWQSAPNKMMYFELIEVEISGKKTRLDTSIVMDVYKAPKAWIFDNSIQLADFTEGTLNVYDSRGRLVLQNETDASKLKRGPYHLELLNEIGRWTYAAFKH